MFLILANIYISNHSDDSIQIISTRRFNQFDTSIEINSASQFNSVELAVARHILYYVGWRWRGTALHASADLCAELN